MTAAIADIPSEQVRAPATRLSTPRTMWSRRLLLRPLRISDARALFTECSSDPQVTRHLMWNPQKTLPEAVTFIRECQAREADLQFSWVVTLRSTGRLIGVVECAIQEQAAAIGYMFGRGHWGKGYAAEAISTVIEWVETVDGLFFLWAMCDTENLSSIRLLERLRFRRGGVMPEKITCPAISNEPRDAYWYCRDIGPGRGHTG
jgi:ribosomal-protein-alanine N-acetyltransferase